MKKKSTKLKQNKRPGMKESRKNTKRQSAFEMMGLLNQELNQINKDLQAIMVFNAAMLEIAELNGLFTSQDVLQMMETNVKNSTVYKLTKEALMEKPTKDISLISKVLGKQMFNQHLSSAEIRQDIIIFNEICPPEEIATLIEKAEVYRKELETTTKQGEGEG